jgi:hypothetical protein
MYILLLQQNALLFQGSTGYIQRIHLQDTYWWVTTTQSEYHVAFESYVCTLFVHHKSRSSPTAEVEIASSTLRRPAHYTKSRVQSCLLTRTPCSRLWALERYNYNYTAFECYVNNLLLSGATLHMLPSTCRFAFNIVDPVLTRLLVHVDGRVEIASRASRQYGLVHPSFCFVWPRVRHY